MSIRTAVALSAITHEIKARSPSTPTTLTHPLRPESSAWPHHAGSPRFSRLTSSGVMPSAIVAVLAIYVCGLCW